MESDDIPWLILERYCAGTCTPEERAQLEAWWRGNPQRQLLASRLRELLGDRTTRPGPGDVERAWSRLSEALAAPAEDDENGSAELATTARPRGARFVTILVVVTLALLLLSIAWYLSRASP